MPPKNSAVPADLVAPAPRRRALINSKLSLARAGTNLSAAEFMLYHRPVGGSVIEDMPQMRYASRAVHFDVGDEQGPVGFGADVLGRYRR